MNVKGVEEMKSYQEMTKDELVVALAEYTEKLYKKLIRIEETRGSESPRCARALAKWSSLEQFCSDLDIDTFEVLSK